MKCLNCKVRRPATLRVKLSLQFLSFQTQWNNDRMRVQTILRATTATPDSALKTVSKVLFLRQFQKRLGAQSSYVVRYLEGSNAGETTTMGNDRNLNSLTCWMKCLHCKVRCPVTLRVKLSLHFLSFQTEWNNDRMRVQTILHATTATPDSALKTVSKLWYVRQFENLHPVLGVLEKIHISEITSFSMLYMLILSLMLI